MQGEKCAKTHEGRKKVPFLPLARKLSGEPPWAGKGKLLDSKVICPTLREGGGKDFPFFQNRNLVRGRKAGKKNSGGN